MGARRTPEDELLLLLAGTRARRAACEDRAHAALREVRPERLCVRLVELRLTGIVGPRVLGLGGDGEFAALEQQVAQSLAATREKGRVDLVIGRAACRVLERHGIAAVPVKGPDLAARVHGDVGARPSSDVDLLVEPAQLEEAIEALGALSYAVTSPSRPWPPEYHHTVKHTAAAMPTIEVHRRVEAYAGDALTREVLGRSRLAAGGLRSFAPVDELALLLLIFARDGLHGLRFPADLSAWWDRYGDELPPQALQPLAERHPTTAVPLATAALVAGRVVGLPADRLLDLAPAEGLRARSARRLSRSTAPRQRTRTALADALLTPTRGLPGLVARIAARPRDTVAGR